MNQKELGRIAAKMDVTAAIDSAVVDAFYESVSHDTEPQSSQVDKFTVRSKTPKPPDGVVLTNYGDLTPKPIQWLWNGWLAQGKMHILAGAPGQGKTTLAMAMATIITNGGKWADGTPCDVGNVLIWSAEDDAVDTLLPRLLSMGANVNRCWGVTGRRIAGKLREFNPATDMAELKKQAHAIGNVKLLIVDPVVSAVTGDSHKNTEVRRALQPLVDLGAQLNMAALGITHFTKGGAGTDPAQRVIGSVAFSAVARVVMVAAKVKSEDGVDGEQKQRRILARSKSNIGVDDGGFEYRLEQVTLEEYPGIEASRVVWGKAVEGTAQELLAEPDNNDSTNSYGNQNDAILLLKNELSPNTPTPEKTARKPLEDAGFTKKQIWAISKKLAVIRTSSGFGKDRVTYWQLPKTSADALPPSPPIPSFAANSAIDPTVIPIIYHMKNVESMESMESMAAIEAANNFADNYNFAATSAAVSR